MPVDPRRGENPDVQGLLRVELGGFEPPTSWVRSKEWQGAEDADLQGESTY
jgi:hypothetical protein